MTYDEVLEWQNGRAYGRANVRAYGYEMAASLYRIAHRGTSMSDAFKAGFAVALEELKPAPRVERRSIEACV